MKILFVTDTLQVGGVMTVISGLSKHFRYLGDQTFIFGAEVPHDNINYKSYTSKTKVYSYKLGGASKMMGYLNILLQSFINAFHIINLIKPDVVDLNLTLSSFGFLILSKRKKFTTIYHFHGAWDLEVQSLTNYYLNYNPPLNSLKIFTNFIKNKIRHNLQKYCLKNVDKIIVLSNYAKNILTSHFGINEDKIIISHGGIDDHLYNQSVSKNIAKKNIGLDPNCKLILVLGRMDPRKGYHILIDSLENISSKVKNFKLIFATSDINSPYFNTIINQINNSRLSNKIFIQSIKSLSDNVQLYQAADIFVSSSTSLETFGLTTIEALSSGAIVVGTPCGATPEILNRIKSYNLVASDFTASSMAKKITEIINLNKNKTKIIKSEIKDLMKQFNWKQVTRDTKKIYLNTANKT